MLSLRVGLELMLVSGKPLAPPSLFSVLFREGYKIPFYYTPTSVHLQNNNSALSYSDFVISAITELLKVGLVVECPFSPVVVNPLSVSVQSDGKKRLILDLRHVNFFVKKCKIKFEDAKSFLQSLLARPTTWACSLTSNRAIIILRFLNPIKNFWVFRGFSKVLLSTSNLRFYHLVFLWALIFSLKI